MVGDRIVLRGTPASSLTIPLALQVAGLAPDADPRLDRDPVVRRTHRRRSRLGSEVHRGAGQRAARGRRPQPALPRRHRGPRTGAPRGRGRARPAPRRSRRARSDADPATPHRAAGGRPRRPHDAAQRARRRRVRNRLAELCAGPRRETRPGRRRRHRGDRARGRRCSTVRWPTATRWASRTCSNSPSISATRRSSMLLTNWPRPGWTTTTGGWPSSPRCVIGCLDALSHPELLDGSATLVGTRRRAAIAALGPASEHAKLRLEGVALVPGVSRACRARPAGDVARRAAPRRGSIVVEDGAEPWMWRIDVVVPRPTRPARQAHRLARRARLDVVAATIATWPDGGVLDSFLVRGDVRPDPGLLTERMERRLKGKIALVPLFGLSVTFEDDVYPWHTLCTVAGRPPRPAGGDGRGTRRGEGRRACATRSLRARTMTASSTTGSRSPTATAGSSRPAARRPSGETAALPTDRTPVSGADVVDTIDTQKGNILAILAETPPL